MTKPCCFNSLITVVMSGNATFPPTDDDRCVCGSSLRDAATEVATAAITMQRFTASLAEVFGSELAFPRAAKPQSVSQVLAGMDGDSLKLIDNIRSMRRHCRLQIDKQQTRLASKRWEQAVAFYGAIESLLKANTDCPACGDKVEFTAVEITGKPLYREITARCNRCDSCRRWSVNGLAEPSPLTFQQTE